MANVKRKVQTILAVVILYLIHLSNTLPIKEDLIIAPEISEQDFTDEAIEIKDVSVQTDSDESDPFIDIENVNATKFSVHQSTGPVIPEANTTIEKQSKSTEENEFNKTVNVNERTEQLIKSSHFYNNSKTDKTLLLRTLRPGLRVVSYSLEIEPNGDDFNGRLVMQVYLDEGTQENSVLLYAEDLDIQGVYFGITTLLNPIEVEYTLSDGILEIFPLVPALSYFFLIEYTGLIRRDGTALYRGYYTNGVNSYLGMNLFPTHARRVFPCVDEPDGTAALSLTVNNNAYVNLVSNALNEGDATTARFSPLSTATHLWGMVAHNFANLNVPAENLRLYGRQGVGTAQTSYIAIMIQSIFNQLNLYTQKNYFEIDANAEQYLHIFALPDITRDWKSLSTVGVWEPYMFMTEVHSIEQRKTALAAISTALSGQWFGYVIFPENWRYAWIVKGLQTLVAYEIAEVADPELDVQTLFSADVIYETMYFDAYSDTLPLESDEDLFAEDQIRQYLNGVVKGKAPAIMSMLKSVLGTNNDYLHSAAVTILNGRSLQSINSLQFQDAVNSEWLFSGDGIIWDVAEFLEPWVSSAGYPVVTVATSTAGNTIVVTQERFSFTNQPEVVYNIPLTFTTRFNPNFDNVVPDRLLDSSGLSFPVNLLDPEEDWIIFNLQGKGYYRVNYDFNLWERLIWALEDPEQREVIHPMNRAALVDDALNLARAGRLDYGIALQVVLTMEHETSYPVWKAFVRNMDFIRKRLLTLDEDDFDDDIYLRMVRRSITAVERDLGFSPDPLLNEDPMVSLTRGLVMEHACKSLYQPCIAAAIDWFYNGDEINNNIPADLRPAVYCTAARERGAEARQLLWDKYDTETVHWERIVILKALACSDEQDYLLTLLQETITDTMVYGTEERSIIFAAVVESSPSNADLAFRFLQSNVNAMMNTYGGTEQIEKLLMILSESLVDEDITNNFSNWANTFWVDGEPYIETARRAAAHALENLMWNNLYLEAVYEWIDENDATGLTVSLTLVVCGVLASLLNR